MIKRTFSLIVVMTIFLFVACSLWAQNNSCIECHSQLEDELLKPVKSFQQDIHNQSGLSCADCHGGNPAEEDIDLAKDSTFKGKPARKDIPEFCAGCHSNASYMKAYNPSLRVDQLTLYWTSYHGQRLKKGDEKVAVCIDCHGVHGIQSASSPKAWTFPWNVPATCGRCHSDKEYMKDYRIPTNQEEEYKASVHAQYLYKQKDLSAPVCNDCHGNHGAAPPEVSSIAQVCRQCHPSPGKLFSQSPHKEAFDEIGIHECDACHGRHQILPPTDEMLGTGKEAVCSQCHEEGSRAYQVALQMKRKIEDLKEKIKTADNLLSSAYKKGVEVSQPRFKLREAYNSLVMARDLTHSLSVETIGEKIKEGNKIVSEVTQEGQAALKEAKLRRTGLIVALIFVFLLALGIYLKVRQINKKTSA